MKLVAASSFRAPTGLEITFEKPTKIPLHVHKGARFSICGDTSFENLKPLEKRIVTELNIAGRIVDQSQTEMVKRIDEEVIAEAKLEERYADLSNVCRPVMAPKR